MSSTLRAALALRSIALNCSRVYTCRAGPLIRSGSRTINHNRIMLATRTITTTTTSFDQTSTAVLPNISANVDGNTPTSQPISIRNFERQLISFEERCQKSEKVNERDFARLFNLFTRVAEQYDEKDSDIMVTVAGTLLRSCGKLMFDTPPKGRELLAGNLWAFIKEKHIPIDISHYNSLIKTMNENETQFDPMKILEEIKAAGFTPDRVTYQRLIQQFCQQGNVDGATNLLQAMKDQGMELNELIFASLIRGYGKQANPPSINEIFELMQSNNVEPGSKAYTAAFVSLAERLDKDPKVIEQFNALQDVLEKDEIQFTAQEIVELVYHLARHMKSNESIRTFVNNTSSMNGSVQSRYQILSSLLRTDAYDYASHLFWSQKVTENALKTGSLGNYWLRALALHRNVPIDSIMNECSKLREKGRNTRPYHFFFYCAADIGRLDAARAALKKIVEEEPMKALYSWPFIAQAESQDEVLDVLKNELSPNMETTDLLETFSTWVWPKFADNAQRLFEANKELKYDKTVLMASFMNYTVQNNKIMESIKFISEAPTELVSEKQDSDETEDAVENPRVSKSNDRSNMIGRLLGQIAEETKDPDFVKKAFEMCKIPGIDVSQRSLTALVKVHLLKDDFKSALEEFLDICRDYRTAPCRSDLMKHCLMNKDPESLQKIMDSLSQLYGEQNSLYDLAVCCLFSNKLKQAQKIFASPGFRVRPTRVYQTCRTIARWEKIDVLENFVSLARDMYDVDQEQLYRILIETYDRTSNANRALNLWSTMQEEDFRPSKKNLTMLADLLEKNNLDVPFQRPRVNRSRD